MGVIHEVNWIGRVALVAAVLQQTSNVLCVRYSLRPDQPTYVASTAVAAGEVLKLVICLVVVLATEPAPLTHLHDKIVTEWRTTLMTAVPSGLYVALNNLIFVAIAELSTPVFLVSYQFKLITTAGFSVLLVGKRLSNWQWTCLGLLLVGVSTVQAGTYLERLMAAAVSDPNGVRTASLTAVLGVGGEGNSTAAATPGLPPAPVGASFKGMAAVAGCCMLTGFAGVWFEKMLKQKGSAQASLWVRNIQLSLFGTLFAFAKVGMSDREAVVANGFTGGYTPLIWFMIVLGGGGGLLIAAVMKYADNILKGFAASLSVVLSAIVSYFSPAFDFEPSISFVVGSALVLTAAYQYGQSPTVDPKEAIKDTTEAPPSADDVEAAPDAPQLNKL